MLLSLVLLGCSGDLVVPDGQVCVVEAERRACVHDTLGLSPGNLGQGQSRGVTPGLLNPRTHRRYRPYRLSLS